MTDQEMSRWANTSAQLIELIYGKLVSPKGVHIETAIAAAASLSGTYLLRFAEPDAEHLTPGTPCISEQVNQHGPELLKVLEAFSAALEIPGRWADVVPKEHSPHVPSTPFGALHFSTQFEPEATEILDNNQIIDEDRHFVLLFTAVMLITMGKETLPPAIGKMIACQALVAGSKTAPAKLAA